MPYLILGFVLLACLLLAARAIVAANASALAQFAGWFVAGIGVVGLASVLILMMASDRFGPALAVGTSSGLFGYRVWRSWRRRQEDKASRVTTDLISMRLNRHTGEMSGRVLRGTFAGRRLEDLDQAELIALWRQCVAEDEPGARLLETYLDRLRPDWRQAAGGTGAGAAGDVMTRTQAYAILDLQPGASDAQIRDAHRRLMMKLHPDHGGSTFLAAQINRAKEFLLGE